jgi:predicted aspartyl protease
LYNEAINSASSAITISQSAVSRDDWNLVANRWQDAINLLKTVPASSPNHAKAQAKLTEYQRHLAEAKKRATPPPKPPQQEDGSPEFFSVPIKAQIRGLAVIEVNVNGKQAFDMIFDTGASKTLITASMAYTLGLEPVGKARVVVADGAIVEVDIAQLQSMEIDGRLKRNFQVAVAPPSMPIGLLGQDFFRGYDVTITNKAIEFRKRSL